MLVFLWIALTTAAFQIGYISWSGGYEWALIGALIGLAQGLVLFLWRKDRIAVWWAAATFIGWIVVLALVWNIGSVLSSAGIGTESGSISGLLIFALVSGPVLGGFQWLVLRRLVHGAGWWIVASSLGLVIAIFLAFIGVIYALGLYSPYVGGVVGLVYGVITAVTLKVILDRPYEAEIGYTIRYTSLILLMTFLVTLSPSYIDITRNPFRSEPSIESLLVYPGAQQVEVFQRRDASFSGTTRWVKSFETTDDPESVLSFYRNRLTEEGWTFHSESTDNLSLSWSNGGGRFSPNYGLDVMIISAVPQKTNVELLLIKD